MSKIYVTGHRNPDIDSLCAAISYADLKNRTDPVNEYIPVHCSPVSDSVKKQMHEFGLNRPVYKKDTYARVRDVMLQSEKFIQATDPIYTLIQTFTDKSPSVLPLFDGEQFVDLVSVDDITSWFLRDNKDGEPTYSFSVENLTKVLPGKLIYCPEDLTDTEGYLLAGAATFDAFSEFLDKDDRCIVFMGNRTNNIEHAMKRQAPGIIITASDDAPSIDYSAYKGFIYATSLGTAEAIRRMRLVEPIITMTNERCETVQANDLFTDAKTALNNSRARGFAVMDGEEYVGFVTRRCFLYQPQQNIIMVDHNEAGQSIDGIEEANIMEIIDHHRLDAVSTTLPIYIAAEPLGSTCTIILEQFKKYGLVPDEYISKVLLTGVIADTLILKSPTTTSIDRMAVEELASLVGVDDIQAYGEQLFGVIDNLASQDPLEKSLSDFKKYEGGAVRFGIGQCEVTTLSNVDEYAQKYIDALEQIRKSNGLDWAMLMITDVLKEKSILLVTDNKINSELPYSRLEPQIYSMPGVMSRKKQLLPAILTITGN